MQKSTAREHLQRCSDYSDIGYNVMLVNKSFGDNLMVIEITEFVTNIENIWLVCKLVHVIEQPQECFLSKLVMKRLTMILVTTSRLSPTSM